MSVARIFSIVFPCVISFFFCDANAVGQTKPALMLANRYFETINPEDYWVSEKLDGVRAYWDGTQFFSRQGNAYHAPDWFVAGFPTEPLDGELWMGRGTFDELSGAVRRDVPITEQWQKIRFMVFDLPASTLDFDHRLAALKDLFARNQSPYIELIDQQKMANNAALMTHLENIVNAGGEGLMLHLGRAPYRAIRSDDLLKLKKFDDDEAVVIEHLPGKGKYTGMLGAVLVEMNNGVRFKIGTGFSDAQRRNPPAIGALITFKYVGKTENGVPRFASFLRERDRF